MNALLMSMIMSWCIGAKLQGPAIINEPSPEVVCRQKLIKCVDDHPDLVNTLPSECLKSSLEVRQ